jgi:hypothetical protein
MSKKQTIKEGWKVVERRNGHYVSCTVLGGAMVGYRLHVWAQPKLGCGPLAVFETLLAAQAFCSNRNDIYPCYYTESEQTTLWGAPHMAWLVKNGLPHGTALADAVYLLPQEEEHVSK